MTHWRPPAVAGTFYPSDPHRLAEQLDRLLSTAEVASTHPPKALIVPHAGHIYSGPMADSGAIFVCATASCTKASAAPGFVRQRLDGAMHPTTYGRSSGFCIRAGPGNSDRRISDSLAQPQAATRPRNGARA